jgi:hypothetical protein
MIDARQQARLNWLLKNRPSDPQVKQLQAQAKQGAPKMAPGLTVAQPEMAPGLTVAQPEQPAAAQPTAPAGLTPRQAARLAWLQKNRPKDPQVAKLQAIQNGDVANPGDDGTPQAPDGGDVQPEIAPDGTINKPAAEADLADKRKADEEAQFKLDNPDEVDEYGNTVTYTKDPVTGQIKRTITAGDTAKRFRELALKAAEGYDPETDRQNAQDATYGSLTKYYDRDKARELEAQKQELAERGIPYDPAAAQDVNSKNLYGRTIGGIDQKYQGFKEEAGRQSILSGNQAYATTASARDSFLTAATGSANSFGADFKQYVNTVQKQAGNDDLTLLSMSADQIAKMRGISVQEAEGLRNDATQREALKQREIEAKRADATTRRGQTLAAKNSGGGGGGKAAEPAPGFEFVG